LCQAARTSLSAEAFGYFFFRRAIAQNARSTVWSRAMMKIFLGILVFGAVGVILAAIKRDWWRLVYTSLAYW
jgi:hypothetical protein